MLIGLTNNELDGYENKSRDHEECCSRVFEYWIDNNPQRTWQALYDLICDIDLRTVADEMADALAYNKLAHITKQ